MALARINEIGTMLPMDVSIEFALPLAIVKKARDVKAKEKK